MARTKVRATREISDRNGVHCYRGETYPVIEETENGYYIDGEQGSFLIPKSSKLIK